MATISSIHDMTAATEWPAEVPGLELPELAGGASWARACSGRCAVCHRQADHKPWDSVGPAGATRATWEGLIAEGNMIRAAKREIQSHAQMLDVVAHAVYDTGDATLNPSYMDFSWPLVSASGNVATVRYASGTSDPRHITWVNYSLNGEWIPGGGGTKYQGTAFSGSLPARGLLLLAGSMLGNHGGWVVEKVEASAGLSIGGTFDLHLASGIGGLATTPDTEGGTVYAVVRIYRDVEPWERSEDWRAFYGARETRQAAMVYPTMQADIAGRLLPEGWTAVNVATGADVKANLVVTGAWSGTAWVTRVTWPNFPYVWPTNMGATVAITGAWESSADSALPVAADRCKWSVRDWTNSHGTEDGDGNKWLCLKREFADVGDPVKVLGLRAGYRPNCWQHGYCPHFAHARTDRPTDGWGRLLLELPWLVEQLMLPSEGIPPQWQIRRIGHPSLASLAGADPSVPDGYHLKRIYPCVGGWPTRAPDAGGAMQWYMGYQTNHLGPQTLDSWPGYHATGAALTVGSDTGAAALDDTSDPRKIMRAMSRASAPSAKRYEFERFDDDAVFQRVYSGHPYTVHFPALHAARTGEQERNDGTVEVGYFDGSFEPCDQGAAVYRALVKIKRGRRARRTEDAPALPVELSATVAAAEIVGDQVILDLEHGETGASSFFIGCPPRQEIGTTWRQGGTNVALPDWARNKNHMSSLAAMGSLRNSKIRAGMSVTLAGTGHARLDGRRMLVAKAEACAGSVGPWDTATTKYTSTWEQGGAITITGVGTVNTVQVKRSQAAQGDYLVTCTELLPGDVAEWGETDWHPNMQLPKDRYYWRQSGTVLYLFFSPLNYTGEAFHPWVYEVTVNGGEPYEIDSMARWLPTAPGGLEDIRRTITLPVAATGAPTVTATSTLEGEPLTATLAAQTSGVIGFGNYKVDTSGDGKTLTIYISPSRAGDVINISTPTAAIPGDQAAQYAARVAIHGSASIPPGHQSWACKRDRLWLDNSDGLVTAATVGALVGRTLTFKCEAVAVGALAVTLATPGTGAADVTLTDGGDYDSFSAEGLVAIRRQLPEGEFCLMVTGDFFDYSLMPRAAEIQAHKAIAQKLLD